LVADADLSPHEKILYILEPEELHICGPLMFIDPSDVIHHNHLMLRYHIFVDILDVVDWHMPSESSSPGEDSDISQGGIPRSHVHG
jgi:hypothetical protein